MGCEPYVGNRSDGTPPGPWSPWTPDLESMKLFNGSVVGVGIMGIRGDGS